MLHRFLEYVESLPAVAQPEVFGLHSNATITRDQNDTTALFESVLLTQRSSGGGGGSGGKSKDETINDVATDILSKLHADYDLEKISAKYPVDWAESMNTVLTQELERYNRLLGVIRSSLQDLVKALKGLVVMSATLEDVGNDLFFGQVPSLWMSKSYPSLKPLASYISDLGDRMEFYDRWVAEGPPVVFWMSGIFFTQVSMRICFAWH